MFHEVQSPSWPPVGEMHAQRSFLVRQRSTKIPRDGIRHHVIIFLRIVVQHVLVVQMIGQRATEFISAKEQNIHSLRIFSAMQKEKKKKKKENGGFVSI